VPNGKNSNESARKRKRERGKRRRMGKVVCGMEPPGVSWRLYTQLTLLKYTLRLKTLNFFMFWGYFFITELFIRIFWGSNACGGGL